MGGQLLVYFKRWLQEKFLWSSSKVLSNQFQQGHIVCKTLWLAHQLYQLPSFSSLTAFHHEWNCRQHKKQQRAILSKIKYGTATTNVVYRYGITWKSTQEIMGYGDTWSPIETARACRPKKHQWIPIETDRACQPKKHFNSYFFFILSWGTRQVRVRHKSDISQISQTISPT